jgi:hypothetical protein
LNAKSGFGDHLQCASTPLGAHALVSASVAPASNAVSMTPNKSAFGRTDLLCWGREGVPDARFVAGPASVWLSDLEAAVQWRQFDAPGPFSGSNIETAAAREYNVTVRA